MVNDELNKIYEWFNANKLSLNAGKTKYSLFRKRGIDKVPWSHIR